MRLLRTVAQESPASVRSLRTVTRDSPAIMRLLRTVAQHNPGQNCEREQPCNHAIAKSCDPDMTDMFVGNPDMMVGNPDM